MTAYTETGVNNAISNMRRAFMAQLSIAIRQRNIVSITNSRNIEQDKVGKQIHTIHCNENPI